MVGDRERDRERWVVSAAGVSWPGFVGEAGLAGVLTGGRVVT